MHMPFNFVLFVHIKYLHKFFILLDVNLKLKLRVDLYFNEKSGDRLICLVQERG